MPDTEKVLGKSFRRIVIGVVAGGVGAAVLTAVFQVGFAILFLGVAVGVGYALAFRSRRRAYFDSIMSAAALGIPLWVIVDIVLAPLSAGQQPLWTVEGLGGSLPGLIHWVLYGVVLGLATQALGDLALRLVGPEPEASERHEVETRVVILGGGFAGVETARQLEKKFGADPTVSLTLVSNTNALLFTPMMTEVATSSLDPSHINTPLRTNLCRTKTVRGFVGALDPERRKVVLEPEGGKIPSESGEREQEIREIPYDHVVFALGSKPSYPDVESLKQHSFAFKALGDTIRIRNHAIDLFERADREPNPESRRTLLTFLVAGGGFAGAELAGGLNDFVRGMLPHYPNISSEEVRVLLLHSHGRILPALTETLAGYARKHMEQRGVTFKLGVHVADAGPGAVVLDSGEEIPSETLVWTAGTRPNPVLQKLPLELDENGAVLVDETLAVPGYTNLWAAGDCAAVRDAKTGEPSPPTAQFAVREAATVAINIHASISGKKLEPFHFGGLGTLAVLGHQTACAEIKGYRFSGLLAWILWRGVYLAKLPGMERKLHVLFDWIIEFFFPRDIVQTIDVD